MISFAIFNNKGGVGKTSLLCNIKNIIVKHIFNINPNII